MKTAIFIDGSNFYHSLIDNCNRHDVNFQVLTDKLRGEDQHIRTYYYNLQRTFDQNPEAYENQRRFFNVLYDTPYLEVKTGYMRARGESANEKGIDVMITADLVNMAWKNQYDTAILISGDGDFTYAAQMVKDIGKNFKVCSFRSTLSSALARVADASIILDDEYMAEVWSGSSE